MLTPAIRRYAQMPLAELEKLNLDKLPAIDVVAIVALLKGTDPRHGDAMREMLANRLDGRGTDVAIEVAVAIQLRWHDGSEA
jgi:hypothetical protein